MRVVLFLASRYYFSSLSRPIFTAKEIIKNAAEMLPASPAAVPARAGQAYERPRAWRLCVTSVMPRHFYEDADEEITILNAFFCHLIDAEVKRAAEAEVASQLMTQRAAGLIPPTPVYKAFARPLSDTMPLIRGVDAHQPVAMR